MCSSDLEVLIPDLFEPTRIAATDLLAQRKAGDVSPGSPKLLPGLYDYVCGKLDRAHSGLSVK